MPDLRSNTAQLVTVGPFLGLDGITPKLGLVATSEKLTFVADVDNGTPGTLVLDVNATASGGNNDMTHIAGDDVGYYLLELTAANLNFIGQGKLSINDLSNHLPVYHEFTVLPQAEYDRKYRGNLPTVNVTQWNGTAQTAGDLVNLINSIIAKTNNLPADPADASDIAGSFAAITTLLNTISGKTTNLPPDPADASDIASAFAALTTLVNAIGAKTTNLPPDPADASDIASAFAALTTAVNAISAKTVNLPPDPADASDIAGAFGSLTTLIGTIPTDTEIADAILRRYYMGGRDGTALAKDRVSDTLVTGLLKYTLDPISKLLTLYHADGTVYLSETILDNVTLGSVVSVGVP